MHGMYGHACTVGGMAAHATISARMFTSKGHQFWLPCMAWLQRAKTQILSLYSNEPRTPVLCCKPAQLQYQISICRHSDITRTYLLSPRSRIRNKNKFSYRGSPHVHQ